MASPVLRINPRLPLVWRNPSTLQIGVDPPVVVIDNLSEGALMLLEALVKGLTPPGATLLAGEAGVPLQECQRILQALDPALTAARETPLVGFALRAGTPGRSRPGGHSTHQRDRAGGKLCP